MWILGLEGLIKNEVSFPSEGLFTYAWSKPLVKFPMCSYERNEIGPGNRASLQVNWAHEKNLL